MAVRELMDQVIVKQTPRGPTNARKLFRMSQPLCNADQHAYIPCFVPLGPYHYRKPNESDYKFNSVATVFQKLRNNFDEMARDIENMRPLLESLYEDWWNIKSEYRAELGLIMAVDCLFLLQFIFGHDRGELGIRIKCDIVKIENQVPLSVLLLVFEKMGRCLFGFPVGTRNSEDYAFRSIVSKAHTVLSPLDISIPHAFIVRQQDLYLLDCIHAMVSRLVRFEEISDESEPVQLADCMPEVTPLQKIFNFLEVHFVEKMCRILFFSSHQPGDFPIDGYTAEKLAQAGIKFKSFSTPSHHIRFDKYSKTLYLPRMKIASPTQTEVFFKNLIALELHESHRGNHVNHFIQLMHALIVSDQDVAKLRNSHVIRLGSALPDSEIANIWISMNQAPFLYAGHQLEPPQVLKKKIDDVLTKKCCMIKSKITLSDLFHEYVRQYLSKPWKVVALLVGIFILGMNSIQAYCSLWTCHFNHSTKISKMGF